jgi:hypothetical protein
MLDPPSTIAVAPATQCPRIVIDLGSQGITLLVEERTETLQRGCVMVSKHEPKHVHRCADGDTKAEEVALPKPRRDAIDARVRLLDELTTMADGMAGDANKPWGGNTAIRS